MFAWHNTPWMWLSMAVFWSLFAVFVYYAILSPRTPARATDGPDATDILEKRFARGEITADEYRERRDLLRRTGDEGRGGFA